MSQEKNVVYRLEFIEQKKKKQKNYPHFDNNTLIKYLLICLVTQLGNKRELKYCFEYYILKSLRQSLSSLFTL